MQLSHILLSALTAATTTLAAPPPPSSSSHSESSTTTTTTADDTANLSSKFYPLCPVDYDTYCCITVVPYTNTCRAGRCRHEYGWSCPGGPGKVSSIRECAEQHVDKTAFCKRPGEEYFPSTLSWTGGSFQPLLEPSDYRHWVRPGMKEPWTPTYEEIRWEDDQDEVLNEL